MLYGYIIIIHKYLKKTGLRKTNICMALFNTIRNGMPPIDSPHIKCVTIEKLVTNAMQFLDIFVLVFFKKEK